MTKQILDFMYNGLLVKTVFKFQICSSILTFTTICFVQPNRFEFVVIFKFYFVKPIRRERRNCVERPKKKEISNLFDVQER